jgi:hypothetical protein
MSPSITIRARDGAAKEQRLRMRNSRLRRYCQVPASRHGCQSKRWRGLQWSVPRSRSGDPVRRHDEIGLRLGSLVALGISRCDRAATSTEVRPLVRIRLRRRVITSEKFRIRLHALLVTLAASVGTGLSRRRGMRCRQNAALRARSRTERSRATGNFRRGCWSAYCSTLLVERQRHAEEWSEPPGFPRAAAKGRADPRAC